MRNNSSTSIKPWLVAPLALIAISGVGAVDSTEAKAEQVNLDVASEVQEQTTLQEPDDKKVDTGNQKLEVQSNIVGENNQLPTKQTTFEVPTDNSIINNTVNEARDEGINVIKEETVTKTASNQGEVSEITEQFIQEQTKQSEEIKATVQEYKAKKDKVISEVKKIEQENEKITENNKNVESYNKNEKNRYEKEKAEALKKTKENGYLKKVVTQALNFNDEPTAKLTLNKNLPKHDVFYELKKNQSIEATYTNLKNSSYAGKKISKAVFVYTAKDNIDYVQIHKNPALTVEFYNPDTVNVKGGSAGLKFKASFYDEEGNVINFRKEDPAVLAFNSLNRTKVYAGNGKGENISNFSSNIKVETINGSGVVYENGTLYAKNYNDYKSNGSKYDSNSVTNPKEFWDAPNSPYLYYGSAVGIVEGGNSISFDINNNGDSNATHSEGGRIWFSFNTKVAIPVVNNPVYKTPSPLKEVPKLPQSPTVNYHDYKLLITPTPTPIKHNYSDKGQLIDNKITLAGGVNNYQVTWDLKPFKGIIVSDKDKGTVQGFIDDYDETKVTPLTNQFTITDSEGNAVNALTMYHVLSNQAREQAVQDFLDRTGLNPKGNFILWIAKDSTKFLENYTQKGNDIYFTLPMKNKVGVSGEYTNTPIQIYFNNFKYGEIVKNSILKPEPKKYITKQSNFTDNSINKSTIKIGDEFSYTLEGTHFPANRGSEIESLVNVDKFDEKVEYLNQYQYLAKVDITLKDGTIIKKGTDITQFVTGSYDTKTHTVTYTFNKDFLYKISLDSEFSYVGFAHVKQKKAGRTENTFDEYINGVKEKSNIVVHYTPEVPVEPKKPTPPVEPIKEQVKIIKSTPVQKASVLPETGEKEEILGVLGVTMLASLGFIAIKRKEDVL